jgi:hypothetical protein
MSKYLPYLYLARFPILTGLLLVALAPLSIFSGLESLLRGLFDLKPWGMFFITMGSLIGAWTVMLTFWIVAAYGWLRFGVQPIGFVFPPSRKATIVFALLAAPLWAGVFYKSEIGLWLIIAFVAGIAAAAIVLWIVKEISKRPYFQRGGMIPDSVRARARGHAARGVAAPEHRGKASPGLGAGYVAENSAEEFPVLPGHGLAIAMFIASLLVYLGVGVLKFLLPGEYAGPPSMAYVLLLIMVACWGLSGAAFFLDRYRVPVAIPLGLWWLVTSQVFPSDHYYLIRDGTQPTTAPAQLIVKGNTGRTIVVATTGGGIQAAGWTSLVLEGLEQKCRESKVAVCAQDTKVFGKSIRLISSVSGGSTGTMYVANEYDPNGGGLPDKLGTGFDESTRSSLDDVAWGLVYPDFTRTLIPLPWRYDRGWALEQAWQANLIQGQPSLTRGYSDWRDGANRGTLPGLIFNSTVVETGQRLLLNTAGVKTADDPATVTFNDLGDPRGAYENKDLAMTTAARLSASFTYVTPVARSDGDRGHMADGGYYDNYGMSTLIQWLRQALPPNAPPVKDVMVIQIRAFPPDALQAKPRRGWLYQAIAPVDALLDVRTAGQYSHNRDEFALLQEANKNSVAIYTSVFEFCGTDAPLSWHLEKQDIDELRREWGTPEIEREWQKVERFLNGKSLEADKPEPPVAMFCQGKKESAQ